MIYTSTTRTIIDILYDLYIHVTRKTHTALSPAPRFHTRSTVQHPRIRNRLNLMASTVINIILIIAVCLSSTHPGHRLQLNVQQFQA